MVFRTWFALMGWMCACACIAAPAPVRASIVFGQVDDFQNGTVMGWAEGPNPTVPVNEPNGGPRGAGDRYLRNGSSGGGGAGGKMVMFNTSQWVGDYNAAGVRRIEADMANFSTDPPAGGAPEVLHMRITLEGGTSFPLTHYSSTTAVQLPADGVWQRVVFDLTPESMTNVSGTTTSLASVLGAVTEMRILSAEGGPAFVGDAIFATLAMDNLRATGLPGDANLDGRVSFADFQQLERGFGQQIGAQWSQGDFNSDGRVDVADFQILREAFEGGAVEAAPPLNLEQTTAIEQFAAAHSVPEPAALCAVSAIWGILVRRRRHTTPQ